jgi:heme-degrading monooxygenase HmoA
MFVDVARWEVQPERWDEAIALFRTEVVPVFERQPGFLRVLLIGDNLSGRGMTVTFWQKEADVRTFDRSGALSAALGSLAGLFVAPPQRVGYPVVFDREF